MQHQSSFTLASMITSLRLLLIPCIGTAFLYSYWKLTGLLFSMAAISDWADGYVARLRNECTPFGALFDALVDKILIISVFGLLTYKASPFFVIPNNFFWFVCGKEVFQCFGFWLLYQYSAKRPFKIRATILGKTTMVLHICMIILIFLSFLLQWHEQAIHHFLLALTTVMMMATLVHYCYLGIMFMKTKRDIL